jgi:SAM-dependent methyltransferase
MPTEELQSRAKDRPPVYGGEDLAVLAAAHNYYNWIADLIQPYLFGHVIEYGAGLGAVSKRLLPYAQRLELVEPEPHLAEQLRDMFGQEPRVDVFIGTLERHIEIAASSSADTVVLVNVLEHIADDHRAVEELVRLLRPNGRLIIFVPALPWLMSDLDRVHGHFRRYYRRRLADLVTDNDCVIDRLHYFDFAGILPWWLVNTIGRRVDFNLRAVRLFDRVVVPLARRFEKLFLPPIGKNLLLVASKR